MSITNRPYAGTWKPNTKKIVSYTPDALVYLNGLAELPGADGGSTRVNIQKYVTQISVDAGTESGATSASLTLSIPRFESAKIYKDGGIIFHTGMEVHIYARGYFPTKGLVQVQGLEEQSSDLPQYPYYHIFHGVVTNVSFDYSGGNYSASLSCSSMLHFWSYQFISTSGSVFGARPTNSGLRTTLRGHNFANKNAYEVLYTLYRDFQGAAHGVSWTFSQKTNIDASLGGRDLYSTNLEYWKRRFSTRLYGLRMYGASGQLYSSTQQAFLSGLNREQAKALIKNTKTGTEFKYMEASAIMRSAYDLGLIRVDPETNKIVGGADQIAAVLPSMTVSPVEISAYVDDVSAWGSANFFESTYESKMDMANKIKEMTDFEFFQDVDGDLVFKPPFYNLDTKSSRVYRIEPEDIISLSFTEGEPEATYYVVRAGHWQQIQGLGMEGEWGVSGRFIDYRLVAQYGWRQGDFETHYYNTPTSAFFTAVSKMSEVNAKINTASLTIPFRPEMRAGYPVYISHIDTYYYVDSFSHSFQYNGQCTTSLQLKARRRKFHAPRDNKNVAQGKTAVDTVDLSRLDLPPTPIISEKNGSPKEIGFPNVVMALDPDLINPLFFITDEGTDFTDQKVVLNLIRKAQDLNLISPKTDSGIYDKNIYNEYIVSSSARTNTTFYVAELLTQAITYGETRERADRAIYGTPPTKKKRGKAGLLDKKSELEAKLFLEENQSKPDDKKIVGLKAEIDAFEEAIGEFNQNLQTLRQGSQASSSGFGFFDLFSLVSTTLGGKDVDRATTLLEMLSDKKSQFTNGSVSGSYRYYSSAHPDPKQQGVAATPSVDTEGSTQEGVDVREGFIKEANLIGVVAPKQFKKNPRNPPANVLPKDYGEVELAGAEVQKGLVVLKAGKVKEPTPTHDIRALSFQDHSFSYNAKQSAPINRTFFDTKKAEKALYRPIYKILLNIYYGTNERNLVDEIYDILDNYERTTSYTDFLNGDGYTFIEPKEPKNFTKEVLLPSKTEIRASLLRNDLALNSAGDIVNSYSRKDQGKIKKYVAEKVSAIVARKWARVWYVEVKPLFDEIKSGTDDEDRTLLKYFAKETQEYILKFWALAYNIKTPKTYRSLITTTKTKGTRAERKKESTQTPIFPVSDNEGYEVIGSFPYGRGLSIEPGANWSRLAGGYDYDPLQTTDPQVVDGLIKALYTATTQGSKDDIETSLLNAVKQNENGEKAKVVSDFLSSLGSRTSTDNDRDNLIREGLRNSVLSRTNSPTKLDVTNAALRLTDIIPLHTLDVPSSFRPAEELFELEAFNGENFIAVEGVDKVVEWAQESTVSGSIAWKERQDALRGVARTAPAERDNIIESIVDSVNNTGDALVRGGTRIRNIFNDED